MSDSQVILNDDHFALIFPYVPDQIAELKKIPGAKWDPLARVWRVPVTRAAEVKAFGTKHDFWIDPTIEAISLPSHPFAPKVEVKGELLHISFPYDEVKVSSIRADIKGVSWDGTNKIWVVPRYSWDTAAEWCKRWGLTVPAEVSSAAEASARARNSDIAASMALTSELEVPGLAGELMDFQRAGVEYLAEKRRSFLADDMGSGKTIQAIATLEYLCSYPAVVVCPPSLVLNWKREISEWVPHRKVKIITGRTEFDETDADVTIIGHSNIAWWTGELSGARSYVFDESAAFKNDKAKRTRAAIKMAKGADVVLCLSGTPITNRPAEFAPQLQILDRIGEFGGKWAFYKTFCGAFRDKWGRWHTDGATNLSDLNVALRQSCYVRRTKDQILPQLPPIRHSVLTVPTSPGPMAEYRRAEDDIIRYVADRAAEIARELGLPPGSAAVRAKFAAEANEHLVRIAALRRLAALAKMDAVAEWVEESVASGNKVVIAAHHRDVVSGLTDRFGGLKIQGGMDNEAVERNKSRFQNLGVDEAPVIVLSIAAAGTGHTLTAAQNVLLVELPWTPADVDQVIARCHRIGQEGSVLATYMLAEDTIDTKIYDLIQKKRAVVDAATDGTEVSSSGGFSELLNSFF